MRFSLRPFRTTDIPFALDQTRREGWTTSSAWFEALLGHDPDLCFVASEGGFPVGMITATRFVASAWVGNLIVVPERRCTGLGTHLMEHVLRLLADAGVRTVRLEADPPGMGIYRRLGFAAELESLRFRLPAATTAPASRALALDDDSLAEIAAFDRPRFGDDRSRLLAALLRRAATAFQLRGASAPAGYALLVETDAGVSPGPWVAGESDAAAELLAACLAAAAGRELRVGVPAPNRSAHELLRSLGFEETAPSVRMVLGERSAGGDPTTIYGIVNGAVG